MKTRNESTKRALLVIMFFIVFGGILHAQTKTIKILAIGNSFSEDAIENYLYELGAAENINFIIGNAYIGGCSLERHYYNSQSNEAAYAFRKIVKGVKSTHPERTLESCITDESWDYISVQQVSGNSGIYYTYFPYLTELLAYVKGKATNKNVKYMLHRTWAYAQTSTHGDFVKYDKNQEMMYSAIVDATNKVKADVIDISFIIPAGTAIQNGRSSPIADNFCRDGYHLDLNIGRYTAACTWFEKITGIIVVGNAAIPANISVFEAKVAQNAAHFAVLKPNEVTSMKEFKGEEMKDVAYQMSIAAQNY